MLTNKRPSNLPCPGDTSVYSFGRTDQGGDGISADLLGGDDWVKRTILSPRIVKKRQWINVSHAGWQRASLRGNACWGFLHLVSGGIFCRLHDCVPGDSTFKHLKTLGTLEIIPISSYFDAVSDLPKRCKNSCTDLPFALFLDSGDFNLLPLLARKIRK